MFLVDPAVIQTVRHLYTNVGELEAALELRRHYPGLHDDETALRCVQTIMTFNPPEETPATFRGQAGPE